MINKDIALSYLNKGLPRVHKYSEVPDGVLTFDFEA